MAGNLRSRLSRIREQRESGGVPVAPAPAPASSPTPAPAPWSAAADAPAPADAADPDAVGPKAVGPESAFFTEHGWQPLAAHVLRRTLHLPLNYAVPETVEKALGVLMGPRSDFLVEGDPIPAASLLFFDLETTGLSGGAGTIAFLAAFGRYVRPYQISDSFRPVLSIDQYLLLDYPGEPVFLDAVELELTKTDQVLVSYNGRSFDSQLLKTRFIMNGLHPLELPHLDLLHPSRCLWKRRLPNCSLAEIERSVLGIDRGPDLSGAEAPEAWFSFLRTGDAQALQGIADHNVKDLLGLSALYATLGAIAREPSQAESRFKADSEALSLRLREQVRRWAAKLPAPEANCLSFIGSFESHSRALLEAAAAEGRPRALLTLGRDRMRTGRCGEGLALLHRLAELARADPEAVPDAGFPCGETTDAVYPVSDRFKGAVFRILAIDAERRLRNAEQALAWSEEALGLNGLPDRLRRDFLGRKVRLLAKINDRRGSMPAQGSPDGS